MDYTRSYFIDRLNHKELQLGDAVYYLSHTSRYAVKKSTIVAKKEIPFSHHSRPFGGCELTLADGTVLEYYDVFDSKEKALEYIVADLKCSLAHHRMGLQTLLQRIAEDERLLALFEKKLPWWLNFFLVVTPSRYLDAQDDCYLVYTLGEVGSHIHPVCYSVFPPTHPVPEKIAAQLKANLEEVEES